MWHAPDRPYQISMSLLFRASFSPYVNADDAANKYLFLKHNIWEAVIFGNVGAISLREV
jgi:hypothetical protein